MLRSRRTCGALSVCPDSAPAEIYTLSLHDALPICGTPLRSSTGSGSCARTSESVGSSTELVRCRRTSSVEEPDRKSTRLNSSHRTISYAVFCLKKKKHIDVPALIQHKEQAAASALG